MVDLQEWFTAQELELCPNCRERSALRTPSGGFRVCLGCGLLNSEGKALRDLRASLDADHSAA